MNGINSLVLDTNIVIYLLDGDQVIANLLNDKLIAISMITELELLSYQISKEDERVIRNFISECQVVEINQTIKERAISLRKKFNVKLPDAIVAATADYLNLPLLTADSEFKKLVESKILIYKAKK